MNQQQRLLNPPPVPIRLQRERELSGAANNRRAPDLKTPQNGFNRHEVGVAIPQRQTKIRGPTQRHEYAVHQPQQNQLQPSNNQVPLQAIERKFVQLEKRIGNLEAEKQASSNIIQQLIKKLHEHVPANNNNPSPPAANIQYIEKTLEEMGKHITSLEEVLMSKDKRIESLSSQSAKYLQTSARLEADLTELKQVLIARQGDNTHPRVDPNSINSQFVHVDKVCKTLNERIVQNAQDVMIQIQELSHQNKVYRQKLDGLVTRDGQSRDSHDKLIQNLSGQIEDLRSKLLVTMAKVEQQSQAAQDTGAVSSQTIQEMREALIRTENNVSDKLAKVMEEVSMRIDLDRQGEKDHRGVEQAELLLQLNHIRDSAEMDRRDYDLRISKLQAEFLEKSDFDDGRYAEFRGDWEARLDTLSRDIQREETSRIDAIRRMHEDVLDQIEGVSSSNAYTLEIQSINEKMVDLEEVVRAEVRSRMRHETKAREHVENTAQTLQAATDQNRTGLENLRATLGKQIEGHQKHVEATFSESIAKLETRFVQDAHKNHVNYADFHERVSSCEAKLSKRAAIHQIDMNKLETEIAQQRTMLEAKLKDLEETIETNKTTSDEQHRQGLEHTHTCIEDLNTALMDIIDESHAKSDTLLRETTQDLNRSISDVNTHIESRTEMLEQMIDKVGNSVSAFEAQQASQSCLESVLDEIEKKEKERLYEETQKELQTHLEGLVESTTAQLRYEMESSSTQVYQQLEYYNEQVQHLTTSDETIRQELTGAIEEESKQRVMLQAHYLESMKYHKEEVDSHLEKHDYTLTSFADECEVRSVLQNIVNCVVDRDTGQQLLFMDSKIHEVSEEGERKLATVRGELVKEQAVSTELKGTIEVIQKSMEDEKKEQEKEWEQSLLDAQSFLDSEDVLPVSTTTNGEAKETNTDTPGIVKSEERPEETQKVTVVEEDSITNLDDILDGEDSIALETEVAKSQPTTLPTARENPEKEGKEEKDPASGTNPTSSTTKPASRTNPPLPTADTIVGFEEDDLAL